LGIRERGAFDADRRRNFFGLSLTYGIAAGSISTPVAGLTR
jgi:hypothetical protein